MRKQVRGIFKIAKWAAIVFFTLLILLLIAVNIPAVHRYVLTETISWFNKKTDGNLSISEIHLRLPRYVQLKEVAFEDPDGNEILQAGEIEVELSWHYLFDKKIELDQVYLSNAKAEAVLFKDENWNFQFVIDAFSSDQVQPEKPIKETTSWDFGIDQFEISNSDLTYVNRNSGDSIHFIVGDLRVEMDDFSTENQIYKVDDIILKKTNGTVQIGQRPPSNNSDELDEISVQIGLNSLSLLEDTITYQVGGTSEKYQGALGSFELEIDELDLQEMTYSVSSLVLRDSEFELQISPNQPDTTQATNIFVPLFVNIESGSIDQTNVYIQNGNQNENISVEDFGIEIHDLSINPESYLVDLSNGHLIYNDEISLNQTDIEASLSNQKTEISHFNIELDGSEALLAGHITYNSFDELISKGKFKGIQFEEIQALLQPNILALIAPDTFGIAFQEPLSISLAVKGVKNEVNIESFDMGYGDSKVSFDANISGASWSEKNYVVHRLESTIERNDIVEIFHTQQIDTTIIPAQLALNLKGHYLADGILAQGTVMSSLGELNLDISGKARDFKPETLSINLVTDNLEGQKILDLENSLTLDFDLQAELDVTTKIPTGWGQLKIDSISYGDFVLSNTHMTFESLENQIAIESTTIDSFLVGEICGLVNLDSTPEVTIAGSIEGADFQSLGFTETDLRGSFDFDMIYEKSDKFQKGNLSISDLIFMRDGKRVELETIQSSLYLSSDSTTATVSSNSIHLNSSSNRNPKELSKAIADMLGGGSKTIADSTAFWKAEFNIQDSPEIRDLLFSKLKTFKPGYGQIDFLASSGKITADFNLPEIKYDHYKVNNLVFNAIGDSSGVNSSLSLKEFSRDSIGIKNLFFSSHSTNQETDLKFELKDDSADVQYSIEALLSSDSLSIADGFDITLISPLILNKDTWDVDVSNSIAYDQNGINIERFNISHEYDSLHISKDNDENSIRIKAASFDLDVFAGILNLPDPIFDGQLFGHLLINNNGSFAGEGYIEDFKVANGQFGHFEWNTKRENSEYIISLKTDGKDVKFEAFGDIAPQNNELSIIDMELNISRIEMEVMPKMFPELISKGDGFINGEVKVVGTNLKPELNGEMRFNDVFIGLTSNGTTYSINNQKVDISTNRIGLNEFTVVDSSGNHLSVNGEIKHQFFQNIYTDLTVTSEDFSLIDVNQTQNNRLYGKLLAGTNIHIQGNANAPTIKANIEISENTNLTYVVPDNEYNEGTNEGLIEWTDFKGSLENDILMRVKEENRKKSYVAKTLDLTGSFHIDKNAIFKVIVDSAAGDYLQIKGGGKLGVSYDRAGNLRINGTYKVEDGFYKMTFYDIVKRTFDFQSGSSLTWNGTPMDATINITALYKTKAKVAGLMATGGTVVSNETFPEPLPFKVLMNVRGNLGRPEITFAIELADERKGAYGGAVEARLNELKQNESELNKQVFALLVLNTFISSDPNANPDLAENQARNSASQILSQQLNSLSDDFIKGVDINFDVQSYTGTAGQGNTDLNIDLEKAFLDDRVVVRVGSTVALESNNVNQANEQTVNTNFNVEYKLTPDGRYRFKVYQKTDLEDIVVGRITRTGAGILFQRDFDRINQIFKKDSNYNPETEPGAVPVADPDNAPEINPTEK